VRRIYIAFLLAGTIVAQPQISERARKLHRDAFIFDGHVHVIDRQLYHGGDIGDRVADG
jgi:membrane dipeptidase